jgi:hypothetical protein
MPRGSIRSQVTGTAMSLPESHWKHVHDVRWPGRSEGKVDHVLVGPSGIYVIQYRSSDEWLRHDAGRPEMTRESAQAADAVAALLPRRYVSQVKPVLCFSDDLALADRIEGVLVTSSMTLEHILRSSPVVLSTSEVSGLSRYLQARLEPVPVDIERPRRLSRLRLGLVVGVAAAAAGIVAFGADVTGLNWIW